MNWISIISDRPDYHSILVGDEVDMIELVGKHPWLILFRAIAQLRLKKLRRYFNAKRQTDKSDQTANIFPLDRVVADNRTIRFPIAKITLSVLPKPQLVLIHGQTVDELGTASSKPRGTQEEKGTGRPEDQESDREPAA